MSSNKRRKIDAGQDNQMLSAAAFRRRLLERQASAATAAESLENSPANAAENSKDDLRDSSPNGGNSKRKAVARRPVAKETSRTPEQVLLGTFGTVAAEDEYVTTESVDEPPKRKVIQLSSINPNKSNLQSKTDGTVVLRFPDSSERLVILGSYGIKVKSGEASIYGASLYSSDTIHWAHAPHCHALPVLRCSEKSIIELHPHPAAIGLRNLERLSPIFGNLWNDMGPGKAAEKHTWQILSSSADGPKKAMLQDLKSPAVWNRKIADLVKTRRESAPVLLVCGPKSSGKSTFTRIVTNKLVTEQAGTKKRTWPGVAVLDIDPGQPEFSPPGTISLVTLDEPNLSPPFCHPTLRSKHVVRSHAVASISPASNLGHYKSCVLDLFSRYKASHAKSPLIINTPGWVQGSGLGLLQDLISAICPAEVLYMSEDGPEDTVEGLRSACKSAAAAAALTTLPSQSGEYTSRTALHLRHMQTMSYFHAVDDNNDNDAENKKNKNKTAGSYAGTRWDPAPLASTPPWLLRYSGADSALLGVMCYGYQPEPELLAEAIDGTVLAIVEIEDHKAFASATAANNNNNNNRIPPPPQDLASPTPQQIPYLRGAAPLDPTYSRCLGLALVRGVDAARNLLALSPGPLLLPADALFATAEGGSEKKKKTTTTTTTTATTTTSRTIVLVAGKLDPPTWAYTEDHYSRAYRRGGGDDDDDDDDDDYDNTPGDIPWAEKLHGGQKRAVGSRVWRVRRDLGRNNSAGGD